MSTGSDDDIALEIGSDPGFWKLVLGNCSGLNFAGQQIIDEVYKNPLLVKPSLGQPSCPSSALEGDKAAEFQMFVQKIDKVCEGLELWGVCGLY